MSGQRHASAALLPGMTRPLYMRMSEPQGRSGRVWKVSAPPGFDPETFQHVASHYTVFAIPVRLQDYIYLICSLAQHFLHVFYVTSFGPLAEVHERAHTPNTLTWECWWNIVLAQVVIGRVKQVCIKKTQSPKLI